MTEKTGKEELMINLDRVKKHLPFQAYQQLREILVDYPKLLKKYHALIGAMNELEDRLELQKPQVSRKEVEEAFETIRHEIHDGALIVFLKAWGIEVTK